MKHIAATRSYTCSEHDVLLPRIVAGAERPQAGWVVRNYNARFEAVIPPAAKIGRLDGCSSQRSTDPTVWGRTQLQLLPTDQPTSQPTEPYGADRARLSIASRFSTRATAQRADSAAPLRTLATALDGTVCLRVFFSLNFNNTLNDMRNSRRQKVGGES